MPWNEPGNNGNNNQDPWTGKNRSGNKSGGAEDMLENLNKKISELFGGSGSGGGSDSDQGSSAPNLGGLGILLAVLFVGWMASGFYTVDARQEALVLRFGAYVDTAGPGLHWHIPAPIESIEILDVGQNRSVQDRNTMLTKDENIIDIAVTVQYKISNPVDYAFNVFDIDSEAGQSRGTLYNVMRGSIREVIGRNDMDFILREGRAQIAVEAQGIMQEILDGYKAGIRVIKVNLTYAEAPSEVKDAFDDANRAREDANRFKNEADTYAKKVVPEARGKAARLVEEANAYQQETIAKAEGDASRFEQLVTEYRKAPEVTRERLYLETMEKVMSGSRKVIIDSKSNNMLYLPLEGISAPKVPLPPPNSLLSSQNSVGTNSTSKDQPNTRSGRNLAPGASREGR